MNSPALSKTRVAVSALMASATLATAGLATTLALVRHEKEETSAAPDSIVNVAQDSSGSSPTSQSSHTSKKQRTSHSSTGFAPAKQAQPASGTSHTRTKGS